jgi:hypothetical protein
MQPVGRPLGAVPRSGGRVAFRVRAPSDRHAGDRPGAGELRVRAALAISAPRTPRLFQAAEDGDRSADDAAGTLRLTRDLATLTAGLHNRTVEIAE